MSNIRLSNILLDLVCNVHHFGGLGPACSEAVGRFFWWHWAENVRTRRNSKYTIPLETSNEANEGVICVMPAVVQAVQKCHMRTEAGQIW